MLRGAAAVTGTGVVGIGGWWAYTEAMKLQRKQRKAQLPPVDAALQPNKSLSCRLRSRQTLTHDTARYRFDLPTPDHVLGMSACSHLLAVNDAMLSRAYTPVTLDSVDKGYFDLVVKRYPGGEFGAAFHALRPGVDSMQFRGPVNTLNYVANGPCKVLGLVGGGTGITPLYQLVRTVLNNPEDRTQLRLLYACKCPEDLLLKSELDALALQYPDRFQVRYLVESETSPSDSATTSTSANATATGAEAGAGASPLPVLAPASTAQSTWISGWWPSWQRPAITNNTNPGHVFKDGRNLAVGRVNPEAMRDFLPAPTDAAAALLVCGPPGMMRFLCGDDRKQWGQMPLLGGLLAQEGYGKAVRVIPFSDRNTE